MGHGRDEGNVQLLAAIINSSHRLNGIKLGREQHKIIIEQMCRSRHQLYTVERQVDLAFMFLLLSIVSQQFWINFHRYHEV